MAYWIFEDGRSIGPLRAIEVLERARPDTLVSEGRRWVRFDRHADFKLTCAPPPEPSAPPDNPAPRNGSNGYWIRTDGNIIGPLTPKAVVEHAGPDAVIRFRGRWIPIPKHPELGQMVQAPPRPAPAHDPSSGDPADIGPAFRREPGRPPAAEPEVSAAPEPRVGAASSPRLRRLHNDYQRVSRRFDGWPLIDIEYSGGSPPDAYRIWYRIKGLYVAGNGDLLEREEHVVEITLGLQYPRRPPRCKLLTPLFHPNFNHSDVCAQDNYAAAEGLDDLIVRIGRMIAYQEYNTKSPLNGIAAKWAAEHAAMLPVDSRELAPASAADAAIAPREAGDGR